MADPSTSCCSTAQAPAAGAVNSCRYHIYKAPTPSQGINSNTAYDLHNAGKFDKVWEGGICGLRYQQMALFPCSIPRESRMSLFHTRCLSSLQLKSIRPREGKEFTQGHTARCGKA